MDEDGGSRRTKKWTDSSYILEIQQTEIANVLTVRNAGRGEIKDNSLDFDLSNWVNGVPCTAIGKWEWNRFVGDNQVF